MAPAKKEDIDEYEKAALHLWDAEYIVIIAGSSFHEPASSTVYGDERCDAMLVQNHPEKFFGFWGEFYNRYADKAPHEGYSILKKWRDQFFDSYGTDVRKRQSGKREHKAAGGDDEKEGDSVMSRCYVATATVDASFVKIGFREDEVYELNGSIQGWQCWKPCTNKVWSIDPTFRFEINSIMREAKSIKYVDDTRTHQNDPIEQWTVHESDDESDKEEPPPKNKKHTAVASAIESTKEAKIKRYRKLCRANQVVLLPEFQEDVPNMKAFRDQFTPAPSSSYGTPQTFTFPLPEMEICESESHSVDGEGDGSTTNSNANTEDTEQSRKSLIPTPTRAPEQPYILKPRINHHLNHVLALYHNKYPYQEGVFIEVDPVVEAQKRENQWQEQQKFFDPMVDESRRKEHIFYNVSIHVLDLQDPGDPPPLGKWVPPPKQSRHPDDSHLHVTSSRRLLSTALKNLDTQSRSSKESARRHYTPSVTSGTTSARGLSRAPSTGTLINSRYTGPSAAPSIAPSSTGEFSPLTSRTAGGMTHRSGWETHRSEVSQYPLPDPLSVTVDDLPAVDIMTANVHGLGEDPIPEEEVVEPEEPWEQGKNGRYFFSYVPIHRSFSDPDSNMFDNIRIEFPQDGQERLAKKGKISIVVECCIFPEKGKEGEDPAKDKKKRKKKKEETAELKPILEPTKYHTWTFVGRFDREEKKGTAETSVISSESKTHTSESRSRRHSVQKDKDDEDNESLEYHLKGSKGHVMKFGVTQTAPMCVKYFELECPAIPPDMQVSPLNQGARRVKVDSISAPMGTGLFAARMAAENSKKQKAKPRPVRNHQLCINCNELARPHVIMGPKKDCRVIAPSRRPYTQWESQILKKLKYSTSSDSLCILELGCGRKVDACRRMSERLFKIGKSTQKCNFIRISTEDMSIAGKPAFSGNDAGKQISIVGDEVEALSRIDRYISSWMYTKRKK